MLLIDVLISIHVDLVSVPGHAVPWPLLLLHPTYIQTFLQMFLKLPTILLTKHIKNVIILVCFISKIVRDRAVLQGAAKDGHSC